MDTDVVMEDVAADDVSTATSTRGGARLPLPSSFPLSLLFLLHRLVFPPHFSRRGPFDGQHSCVFVYRCAQRLPLHASAFSN